MNANTPTGPVRWTPDRIRRIRELHGMTIGDLADHLGTSHSTVRNWERGITTISEQYRKELRRLMAWDFWCEDCGAEAMQLMSEAEAVKWADAGNEAGIECANCGATRSLEPVIVV